MIYSILYKIDNSYNIVTYTETDNTSSLKELNLPGIPGLNICPVRPEIAPDGILLHAE